MGRRPKSAEKTILSAVKDILSGNEPISYYILWRYAPEMLKKKDIRTFEDLINSYSAMSGITEDQAQSWVYREDAQRAIKYIYRRMATKRNIDILDTLYERALDGDTKAIDGYLKMQKALNESNAENEEEVSLIKKIQNINLSKDKDIEEYKEGFWE